MPIFWADFFADTEHMSPDGAKAYLFLLGHAWLRGAALPNDDRILARLARVSNKSWVHIRAEILTFWTLGEDGFLRQKRLSKEHEFVCRKVAVNRKNGSVGGMTKQANKSNENKEAILANASETLKQPTLTLTPTVERIEKDNLTVIQKETGNYRNLGTRLPDDFLPDGTCQTLAETLMLSTAESQQAFDNFRDYWKSLPGSKSKKLDWQATFRNWLRNSKGKSNGKNHAPRYNLEDSFAVVDAVIAEAERREAQGNS